MRLDVASPRYLLAMKLLADPASTSRTDTTGRPGDHSAADRRAATRQEYEALGEEIRAEYVDGQVVASPAPTASTSASASGS